MTNSILIGKVLYGRLKDIKQLEGRIYPVIAEQSTLYPFAVYYRTGLDSVNYTKDGYGEDSVNFTIAAVADKYYLSCDIANEIRKALELQRLVSDDMVISNVRLLGVDESYEDNAYVQRLNFECKVNNK